MIAFHQIVQISEDNIEAWNNLGAIYEELGSIDHAIYAYSKSLTINNYQEDANFHIARLQYLGSTSNHDPNKSEEIKQRLQFVLSVNPNHFGAKRAFGDNIQSIPADTHDHCTIMSFRLWIT